jgi:hypothetical protein
MKITYQVQIRDNDEWLTVLGNIGSHDEALRMAWVFAGSDAYPGTGIQIIAEKPKQEYDFRSDKELMSMLNNRCTL